MPTYLLAAEADRIQNVIFRSYRLREVSGASHRLEEFWTDVATLLVGSGAQAQMDLRVPVRSGGTIRALFESRDKALAFARDLSDLYQMRFGSRITVARPVPVASDSLANVNQLLAAEKAAGDHPATVVDLPYLRPCESCGARPAAPSLIGQDERQLCGYCWAAAQSRDRARHAFVDAVMAKLDQEEDSNGPESDGADDPAPLDRSTITQIPSESEQVGRLDPRNRVAYLLADGNGFGQFFADHDISSEEGVRGLAELSSVVTDAGRGALAQAAAALIHAHPDAVVEVRDPEDQDAGALGVPVLPLITGGDDVFALITAPWAFWFAREFAIAFERAFDRLELEPKPRISCALVFCKAAFPYRLAYEVGHSALSQVKRLARSMGGTSLIRGVEVTSTVRRDRLGPANEYGVFSVTDPVNDLLSLDALLDARTNLDGLPGKRRHELEQLYSLALDARGGDSEWQRAFKRLISRAGGPGLTGDAIADELRNLGPGAQLRGPTPLTPGGTEPSSAAVDLLHLWDYLLDLSKEKGGRR